MQSQLNRKSALEVACVPNHLKRKVSGLEQRLHLRWLATESFQNYETVNGGYIPSKNKFKTQKHNKIRWLASDINLKLLHTGCSIAHEPIDIKLD